MSRVPYQLLELAIISGQDLASVSRNLRTYATTWIDPNRKLKTRVDNHGLNNPTWNDKFIFRVDDKFLNSATATVMIEIYAQGWLRDTPVGSVSVLVSNLIPPSVRQESSSRRFVALQIRRPSGRPQGILNMGVSLLDNTMKSMPLYADLDSSAVGVRDLMEEKLCKNNKGNKENDNQGKAHRQDGGKESSGEKKIQLLRTLSDQTDLTRKQGGGRKRRGSSVCNVPYHNPGSMLNIGGSSVVGGGSVVNAGGSYVNGSQCNSDLGPSPSVVAAAVACGLYPTQLGPPPKPGSSVLEDWAVEESSMEGLKSKIERWRMELPQNQRYQRLEDSNKQREKKRGQRRRKTANDADDDETGRFSCFGNAYGCEFTIVCGSKTGGRKSKSGGYTSSKTSTSEV